MARRVLQLLAVLQHGVGLMAALLLLPWCPAALLWELLQLEEGWQGTLLLCYLGSVPVARPAAAAAVGGRAAVRA